MDDVLVDSKGFRANDLVTNFLDSKMKELKEVSPSEATLNASFFRQEKMVQGSILIRSTVGEFKAFAVGKKLKDVTRHLSEQIKHQFEKWKTARFRSNI